MTRLEPLKFQPSLREKVWGANDLAPVLGTEERRIGEAWCAHDGARVADGPLTGRALASLLAEFGDRLMGPSWKPAVFHGPDGPGASYGIRRGTFPIFGKLLFCRGDLSIQVHPDDAHARRLEGCLGKTELWYVIAAKQGAHLGLGLAEEYGPEQLAIAAGSGEIERLVRWIPARPGQCVLLPAGTVHSAGGGVVLCEIQQNSDLTYRLYDYRRQGLDGLPRSLQIERAVQVADTESRPAPTCPQLLSDGSCRVEQLGRCPYFAAELLCWDQPFLYTPDPRRCQLLLCIRGCGSLNAIPFQSGDAFLIPAEAARFPVDGLEAQAVRAYLP